MSSRKYCFYIEKMNDEAHDLIEDTRDDIRKIVGGSPPTNFQLLKYLITNFHQGRNVSAETQSMERADQ